MARMKSQPVSSMAEEKDNPQSLPKAETAKMITVNPSLKKVSRPSKR